MLKNLLQKIEEKYVFNISHYFWHIFVVVASLALIAGVLILLWGIIPPGKNEVQKAEYPPVVQVTSEEVLAVLKNMEEKTTQTKTTYVPPPVSEVKPITYSDPDEKYYNQSLDSLKILIPPTKYSWESSGYWYYPYGENYYRYYRERGYDASSYRSWIVSETGINEKLEDAYLKSNATNFKQKKLILDAYIPVVKKFSEEKRTSVLKTLANYTGNTASETVENIRVILDATGNFDREKTDFINILTSFGSENPTEGKAFIAYTNKIILNFVLEYRVDVLKSMVKNFYKYFNNKVNQQIEITDLFVKDLLNYKPDKHVKALETYYNLMVEKNYQRQRKISEIDDEYTQSVATANAEYEMAKVEKAGFRLNGLYLVGGAISLIAVLALILVLLSIQRYVKRINENIMSTDQQGRKI